MKSSTAQNFYNALSADYDSMINFDASLLKRKEMLKNFIQTGDDTAADLGCGSGLDSIALSKLGLKVTGFDISHSMVEIASGNAARCAVKTDFLTFPINQIPKKFNGNFSFAVSLGNSLANINSKKIALSIERIYNLLKPGGHILIQILNYNRILSAKERIVGVTERGNCSFIRFYDFEKDKTFFNILKIERTEKVSHSLITTEIFPYKSNELVRLFKEAGFKKLEKYGGLDGSKYLQQKSQDLVISAFK